MIPLTDRQLYDFDLQGYAVVRRFLTPAWVRELNQLIDASPVAAASGKFAILQLGDPVWNLLSDMRILRIAEYLCGPWFRFDHAYGIQTQLGDTTPIVGDLHAGQLANQRSFQYGWRDGRPWTGMLVFVVALRPVGPGDGGLVFLPGSHKSNLPLEGRDVFELYGRQHDWPTIQQPVLEAGDLLLFTEATIHGTRSWTNARCPRRNLYYRYCPGHMCWRNYAELRPWAEKARTPLERQLLRPPYVGGFDEADHGNEQINRWRQPTLG